MELVSDSSSCVTVSWTHPVQSNVCQPQAYQVSFMYCLKIQELSLNYSQYRCASNTWITSGSSDNSHEICDFQQKTEVTCYVKVEVQNIWSDEIQKTVTTPCTSKIT